MRTYLFPAAGLYCATTLVRMGLTAVHSAVVVDGSFSLCGQRSPGPAGYATPLSQHLPPLGRWLQARGADFAFHLRSAFPDAGRVPGWPDFWVSILRQMSLSAIMTWLDHHAVSVP
jgi:hypothetical protein